MSGKQTYFPQQPIEYAAAVAAAAAYHWYTVAAAYYCYYYTADFAVGAFSVVASSVAALSVAAAACIAVSVGELSAATAGVSFARHLLYMCKHGFNRLHGRAINPTLPAVLVAFAMLPRSISIRKNYVE